MSSVGRIEWKVNNVIGLKRKSSKTTSTETPPAKKKFLDLDSTNQSLTIVRWLTNKPIDTIISKKTARHEIIEDPNIFNRLRNHGVDISGTKKYFEKQAFQYLRVEVENLKLYKKPWRCTKCSRNLSGDQIMCHSCLDWFHVKCTKYKEAKGNSNFFCDDCLTN